MRWGQRAAPTPVPGSGWSVALAGGLGGKQPVLEAPGPGFVRRPDPPWGMGEGEERKPLVFSESTS